MKKLLSLTGILVLAAMTATTAFAVENGMINHVGNTHQPAMTHASTQGYAGYSSGGYYHDRGRHASYGRGCSSRW